MPAFDVRAIARGVLLVHLHIAQQTGARIATFDQIVAEDLVVRQATFQRAGKSIHLVDALADERALLEQVLIDVRDRSGIGIDTGIAAEQLGVGRAGDAGQADAHARLQNGVPGNDVRTHGIEHRPVQRVHHGGHTMASGIPWQQCV
nr:hypothetical protein [Tanacetum cinerariifolium]